MIIHFSYPYSASKLELELTSIHVIDYFSMFYIEQPNNSIYKKKIHIYQDNVNKIVECDGKKIKYSSDEMAIVIICNYIRENLIFENEWNAYHGSSISINGNAYLFLGNTGAGKTTLSAYLSKQKNSFVISEDISIVNSKTLKVVYRNIPIALRKNGYKLLEDKYGCKFDITHRLYNGKLVYNPPVLFDKKIYDLKACFLLNLDIKNNCTYIKKNDKEINYILNSFCHNTMKYNLKCALKLSSRLPMYELYYGDLRNTFDFLKKLQFF